MSHIAAEHTKTQHTGVKLKLSSMNKENGNGKVFNAYTSFTNELHSNSQFLNQSQSNLSQKYPGANTGLFKKCNAVLLVEKKK